jgi:hypothetical protein
VAPLMEQFIILGLVPGTDIQIGFDALARLLAMTTVLYLTVLLIKEKRLFREQIQEIINQKAL